MSEMSAYSASENNGVQRPHRNSTGDRAGMGTGGDSSSGGGDTGSGANPSYSQTNFMASRTGGRVGEGGTTGRWGAEGEHI